MPEIKPLDLTPAEREKVFDLDQQIWEKLEPLRNIPVDVHTIYPDYFLTDKGWRACQLVYGDQGLGSRMRLLAKERGISWDNENAVKGICDEYFTDIKLAIGSDDLFGEYLEKRAITITPDNQPASRQEAEEYFHSIQNLAEIPAQILDQFSTLSSDYAKSRFIEEFGENNGNVAQTADPVRISRLVDSEKLLEKITGLRALKRELKQVAGKDDSQEPLAEAKTILAHVYGRYLNVVIAEFCYPEGRVLASQPGLTVQEKKTLDLIRGHQLSAQAKGDRFAGENASRTMERIDHFLRGTGVRMGEDGLLETIPESLQAYIEKRAQREIKAEPKEDDKYGEIKINAAQSIKLVQTALKAYGLDQQGWAAQLTTGRIFSVTDKGNEGAVVKRISVPEKGGTLVGTLMVIAHEMGHVLRLVNREHSGGLRLLQERSTGRSNLFSEAGAMWVESMTKQRILGSARLAGPYYGMMMLKKQEGGSFKDCFAENLRVYAQKQGKTVADLMKGERWEKEARSAYGEALRIFRSGTPLADNSKYIPTSEQLNYIEGEMIAQALFEAGLSKLLFLGGIDLYSLGDLKRLGVLDLDQALEPQMVVARQIWPSLSQRLDEGKSLDEAIALLDKDLSLS